jgi:soluble lytic murein transglycosylase-like protein
MKILTMNLMGITLILLASLYYGRLAEAELLSVEPVRFSDTIMEAGKLFDIDPALIAAVIQTESQFRPRAISPRGAKGLMQINAPTQRYLRLKNVYDPRQNIFAGSRYLRELLDRFDGELTFALAAYNAGPGAVARHDGIPPYKETKAYVKKVLAQFARYQKAFAADPFVS